MQEMQIFKYEENEVRTINQGDETLWILKDVCDILEIGNSRMVADRLDDDEKGVSIIDTPGGKQELTTINESGLYSTILLSRKLEAKKFKRWVTHEVLPTIRKHGAYLTPAKIEEVLLNPDAIIQLATTLKKEREQRMALEGQIEKQKPKVIFADAVAASQTSILIGELAKILKQNGVETGQNRLFVWLRNSGYLISRKGTDYNMPTQRSMELDLFEIKETSIAHADGHTTISKTPKVTGKGQTYFINKFLKKEETA